MTRQARILIAEDQPLTAEALAVWLSQWYDVVATVTALGAIAPAIELKSPDVAVLDLSFGEASVLPLVPSLVQQYPGTKFVVLTVHADRVYADAAFRAGASAFVVKHSAPSELHQAIAEVLAGRTYVTPLINAARGGTNILLDVNENVLLTARQREVLKLLHAGHSRDSIGKTLEIATKTVDFHVEAIKARVGITNTAQLIRWADGYLGAREK